jgi:tyrosyl-tRNA synthetase
MDLEDRIDLIKSQPVEELVTEDELRKLLESKSQPTAFDAILPSGMMHLGMVLGALKAQDIIAAGCKFIVFVADWHAYAYGALGGRMEDIRSCAEYHQAAWASLGLTSKQVRFVFASELYDSEYWMRVLQVGRTMTVAQAQKCLPIMGRVFPPENLELVVYTYIPMQIADIFHLEADICSMAMDQRSINIVAREVAGRQGRTKPILVHRHLLMGLMSGRQESEQEREKELASGITPKMSKSLPDQAIFVHDSPAIIRSKILSAYCPPKNTSNNPLIEICKYILMRNRRSLKIERSEAHGGDLLIQNVKELETIYQDGTLHPLDLKNAVSEGLIEFLEPCRRYFESRSGKELLEFQKNQIII